jgi:hypothetical protein
LRACRELGITTICTVKDFRDKPIKELEFVVSVNVHRRHLDEFQKAEIGIKMRKIVERIEHHKFTSSTEARAAVNKRYKQMPSDPASEDEKQEEDPFEDGEEEEEEEQEGQQEQEKEVSQVSLLNQSREQLGSNESNTTTAAAPWAATNETLAKYVGVSTATMAT